MPALNMSPRASFKLGEPFPVAGAKRRSGLHLDADDLPAVVLQREVGVLAIALVVVQPRLLLGPGGVSEELAGDERLAELAGDLVVVLDPLDAGAQQVGE